MLEAEIGVEVTDETTTGVDEVALLDDSDWVRLVGVEEGVAPEYVATNRVDDGEDVEVDEDVTGVDEVALLDELDCVTLVDAEEGVTSDGVDDWVWGVVVVDSDIGMEDGDGDGDELATWAEEKLTSSKTSMAATSTLLRPRSEMRFVS